MSGQLSHALDVTRTRVTFLTMGRRQRVCAIALIPHPWCSRLSCELLRKSGWFYRNNGKTYIFIFLKKRLGMARTTNMIQNQNQGR